MVYWLILLCNGLLGENKKITQRSDFLLVPKIGVEPIRCCHRGILSPLRLPIPPFRHIGLIKL